MRYTHTQRLHTLYIYTYTLSTGDVNKITVGEQSSIGDKAVVHAAKLRNDLPTNIGSRVTVGKTEHYY